MLSLLLASTNRGKLVEIQAILAEMGMEHHFRLILPADIGLDLDVVEDGKTYAENAARKALAYSQVSGLCSLADDSGLEVSALGGEPGLFSARYSGISGATDADRRNFLLQKLSGKEKPWQAAFHCTVALANPQGALWFSEGSCAGEIIDQERGENGFGYDPIFYMPNFGKTMAEVPSQLKNHISHRAQAIQNARPVLLELFMRTEKSL